MIRLVTQPVAHIVGKMIFDLEGVASFLESQGVEWNEFDQKIHSCLDCGDQDAEWLIHMAYHLRKARQGTTATDTHESLVRTILEQEKKHYLRHAVWTLVIRGVSWRTVQEICTREPGLACTFSLLNSLENSAPAFIVPKDIQLLETSHPEIYQAWVDHIKASAELSDRIRDHLLSTSAKDHEWEKRAQDAANSVLPAVREKVFMMTACTETIRNMITRLGIVGNPIGVRSMMNAILTVMKAHSPNLVSDLNIRVLANGLTTITKS